MTLRGLFKAWNEFFFKPQSPTPVCLFRIFYGLVVIADLIMLRPEWLMWYGPHAFVSLATTHLFNHGPNMNLIEIIPQTDLALMIFYWAFLASAVMLTTGYMTRFNAVTVYLCLGSIEMRNGFILNSGDTLMLVCGFFLMFAPSGAAFSVDRWLAIRRGKVSATSVPLCSPWAQRMLQIQTAVVYFSTFYWKSMGILWINGTAVYYALHLQDFRHFPVPAINSLFIIKSLTWGTLLIEFALGVLIWFKELRYPVLIAGLCLHLGIEYAMNIPLFEWMAVATYVNFIEPQDLTRMWNWVRSRFSNSGSKLAPIRAAGQEGDIMSAAVNFRDGHI
jgi:vitamin K-dependent gamma-carboxylase-like protein